MCGVQASYGERLLVAESRTMCGCFREHALAEASFEGRAKVSDPLGVGADEGGGGCAHVQRAEQRRRLVEPVVVSASISDRTTVHCWVTDPVRSK